MTELYLIAHKVRGEPAFDIAINIHDTDDEPCWIIPTSGHRAYPYWFRALSDMELNGDPCITVAELPQFEVGDMPADLPEHYEVSAAPKGKGSGIGGRDLLAKLGMIKPREPMSRRNW